MSIDFHEALLYTPQEKNICRCDLCPRECLILPHAPRRVRDAAAKNFEQVQKENIGFCGTRINLGGKLFAVNYGRITSLAVDPVEKKPLYHFLPGENLLSIGSFGCNFCCPNCHNWEISQTASLIHNRPTTIQSLTESFSEISPAEVVSQAVEHGCSGIAYTYNEPTVFLEFALDVMKLAKKAKLKNVWVSNGFFSEQAWDKISTLVDAFNIDLKSFDQHFYQSHCKASIEPVANNLRKIKEAGMHLEVTTLIIPGLNDKENILRGIASFIAKQLSKNIAWHLIDFSSPISWQMQDWKSAGIKDLEKAYRIGKEEGLKFVYANNLPCRSETTGADTFCPNCGEMNIRRFGYEIERLDDNGTCFKCGQNLHINLHIK